MHIYDKIIRYAIAEFCWNLGLPNCISLPYPLMKPIILIIHAISEKLGLSLQINQTFLNSIEDVDHIC
jgi:hypothetical protein